jgi:hypothetical protein
VNDSYTAKRDFTDQLTAATLIVACPHCGGQEYLVPAEQQKRILRDLLPERLHALERMPKR